MTTEVNTRNTVLDGVPGNKKALRVTVFSSPCFSDLESKVVETRVEAQGLIFRQELTLGVG